MEPERKIEKLLRAYARKRRADAGEAFKLHPATRRMLQGEVARQAPKADNEPESLSLWELLRERWAILLGFALVIFFGASLFLPALSTGKRRYQAAESSMKLKEIGMAAQIAAVDNRGKLPATLDALTNQLGSRQALTDSVSGKPFVYVAGGANMNDLKSSNVLAYSPADKDRSALFADGSVRQLRSDEIHALTSNPSPTWSLAANEPAQRQMEQPAPAATAAPAPMVAAAAPPAVEERATRAPAAPPAVAPPAAAVSGTTAKLGTPGAAGSLNIIGGTVAQNTAKFKSEPAPDNQQIAGNNSQRYQQVVNTKFPSLLNTFEVRQNGNQLAVVSQDGSIYHGVLQPAPALPKEDVSKTKSATLKPGSSDLLKKDSGVAANNQASAQNYSFRVSGANRSLKQNVVFTGNIIADDAAAVAQNAYATQNAVQNASKNQAGQSKLANGAEQMGQSSLFSNARISGMVTIDHTNQMEINALPVAP